MIVLPNGLTPKRLDNLTFDEMNWLAQGEHMCRKLNLTIACPTCLANGSRIGAVLRGGNDEADQTMSVTCDCRRMVFQRTGG